MTHPFCLPARMMAQTSLTSLLGSIINVRAVHQLVIGDVHADRAVAGRRGVDRHTGQRGTGHDRVLLAPRMAIEQILAEAIVELRGRHRTRHPGADQKIADVGVGFEQHAGRKQHVVDADDPLFVELDVVEKWGAAVEREVQRVVQVVVEVRAGADDEVDEPAVEELDDAAAEPRGGQGAGDGQSDRGVVGRIEHLVGEDVAGLGQAAGIEGLKPAVDQLPDVGAAARPVVLDGFSRQVVGGFVARGPRRSVGHTRFSIAPVTCRSSADRPKSLDSGPLPG